MTSTDAIHRRQPPLPGLLDDTLDAAMRTRQRRIMIAAKSDADLQALATMDRALDEAVLAAALYGNDADAALAARIDSATDAKRAAAVFLRIAVAVQRQSADLPALVADYQANTHDAVRDALWFFPVARDAYDERDAHIVALFEQAQTHAPLLPLALHLAGLRAVKPLRARIEALLALGATPLAQESLAQAYFALACLGAAPDATRRYLTQALTSTEPAHYRHGLAIAAVAPRLADNDPLEQARQSADDPDDVAWAILACRYPRMMLDHARQHTEVPMRLRLRLLALTGYLDGLIQACGQFAAQEGPIAPQAVDVLALALGEVPMQAVVAPNDPAEKDKALRSLLLKVLRHNHIALRNDADRCPWDVQAILAKPAEAAGIRLRHGDVLRSAIPALAPATAMVTRSLRQWLYIERAEAAGQVLALSPLDHVRRQYLLLGVAELADALRA